jgi:hypothetical protein
MEQMCSTIDTYTGVYVESHQGFKAVGNLDTMDLKRIEI